MIKKKWILALACMICILAGIAFPGSFTAAETVPAEGTEGAETFVFVNEYTSAGSFTWDISKTVEGRPLRAGEQFTFAIEAENEAPLPRDAGGTEISSYTLEIASGEAGGYTALRSLPVIPFTNADLGGKPSGTFTYRITEMAGSETYMTYDPEPKILTLLATDQGDGTIRVTRDPEDSEEKTSFKNVYARDCSAAVSKVWDDAENQDGKRPEELMAELHRRVTRTLGDHPDGTTEDEIVLDGVSLNEGNGWAHRENNLPCWDRWGNAYSYYWKEYTLAEGGKTYPAEDDQLIVFNGADYTCETQTAESTESGTPLTETSLTNRHAPALADLTVRKIWEDSDNEQGMRPRTITVQLYANNRPTGLAVRLGAGAALINGDNTETYSSVVFEGGRDPFTATLKNLPEYTAGVRQTYTWLESDRATDSEGNEKSLADDLHYAVAGYSVSGNTTTITNWYDPQNSSETTTVTVRKVWDDRNNQDGIRPASIVMTLSNGIEAELNAGNGWTVSIGNLPRFDTAGNEIAYTWTEPQIRGYRQKSVTTSGSETTFVNEHTPEVTSTKVVKVWDDADNAAGLRPANLRVTLSNGSTYYLNEGNGWTVTVNGLPAYDQGRRIRYTWSEQSVLGYTSSSVTEGTVTTFTNHFPGNPDPEPGEKKKIRLPDNSLVTIEDLPTPLGVGGIINHVGDTFE